MIHKITSLFGIICITVISWSCSASYSFTGASISPEIKTISIEFFPSYAPLAPPTTAQLFTEALRDVFLSQTNLVPVKSDGDIEFEGSIVNYTTQPVAVQGNEVAALTRVSMAVKVKFTNNTDEKQSFETTFSRFEDFESSLDLSAVEEEIIRSINDQLTQDIFNKAVTNW